MLSNSLRQYTVLLCLAFLLVGCDGSNGKNGKQGAPALVVTLPEAVGANCAAGGWRIQAGTDNNHDGALADDEVQSVSYVCNGLAGQAGNDGQDGNDGIGGINALTKILPIDSGTECAAGGFRIQSGVDTNRNNILDTNEIQDTALVCNGVDGKDGEDGQVALIDSRVEQPGSNCPAGGLQIISGLDANLNGSLETDEISRINYICHGVSGNDGAAGSDGSDGLSVLVRSTQLNAGAFCAAGGYQIDSGLDANRDGILGSTEINNTSYICNGSDGADGSDGSDGLDGISVLVKSTTENAGLNCAAGGLLVQSGVDLNRNGILNADEVTESSYLCNGQTGQDGSDGTNGTNALIKTTVLAAGSAQCAAGGHRIESGVDINSNNILEAAEVTATSHICNGVVGANGTNGSDGANGTDGTDGVNAPEFLMELQSEAPGSNCPAGGQRVITGLDADGNNLLQGTEIRQEVFICNGQFGGPTGDEGLTALVEVNDEPEGSNCPTGGVHIVSGLDTNKNNILDTGEIQSSRYICNGYGFRPSFILQYNVQAGGVIVGASQQTVKEGESGSAVTAQAATGYSFTGWSDGLLAASRQDSDVHADVVVTAGFSAHQYTLNYSAEANGSVVGIASQTVFYSSHGTAVEAVPAANYRFVEWSDGRTDNPRTDYTVTANLSVAARFELNQYTLSYSAGVGGSLVGSPLQQIMVGSNGSTVAAIPSAGHRFVQWSDGVTTANRTDINVQASLGVAAEFKLLLSPPEGVQLDTINGELIISWPSVPGATTYNLYYAKETGVTPANYSALLGGGMQAGVSSPMALDHLDVGHRYYFVFTTVINGQESAIGDEVTALLPQTPWLSSSHQGRLQVEVKGTAKAEINWAPALGETYNIYISKDPDADLSQYASYGVNIQYNATPPVLLENLNVDEPVYIALETNGVVSDWTQFMPRTWGVNGDVLTQTFGGDGTRYVGGDFTVAGMNTGGGAAFAVNTANTQHLLAAPEIDGTVYAVISDGKGGWYIGGDFTRVANEQRLRLAHIDRSGRLSGWNPGADNTVRALAVYNDTIYVGGDFLAAGAGTAATARSRLAAFNTQGDLIGWDPHSGSSVKAMVIGGNRLYVGGFNNRLAVFDAATRTQISFPNSFNGTINALAYQDGVIYIGGSITAGAGFNGSAYTDRSGVIALNTSGAIISWMSKTNGTVNALAVVGNTLHVGGHFNSVKSWREPACQGCNGSYNTGVNRNNLASFSTVGYGAAGGWAPNANGVINAITYLDSAIYVGGDFTAIGGVVRNYMAVFPNGSSGVGDRLLSVGGPVHALFAGDNSTLYVGGKFTIAGGAVRNHLAAFDATGGLADWNPGANGIVKALVQADDIIYAGGAFTLAGAATAVTERLKLAAFDTLGNLTSWNAATNSTINTLAVMNNTIYVGGVFSHAGKGNFNTPRNRLAGFDLAGNLLAWNPNAVNTVNALVAKNGIIYAAGNFTNRLAAYDQTGNLISWGVSTNLAVTALAVVNDTIYAGGDFTTAVGVNGNASRNKLVAFDSMGNLSLFNPGANAAVNGMFADSDTLYLWGDFTGIGGGGGNTNRSGLAALNISTGTLKPWQPLINGKVNTLNVFDGDIYIGGTFSAIGNVESSVNRSNLAVFDEAGQLLLK